MSVIHWCLRDPLTKGQWCGNRFLVMTSSQFDTFWPDVFLQTWEWHFICSLQLVPQVKISIHKPKSAFWKTSIRLELLSGACNRIPWMMTISFAFLSTGIFVFQLRLFPRKTLNYLKNHNGHVSNMTSWCENAFCIRSPLWVESAAYHWISKIMCRHYNWPRIQIQSKWGDLTKLLMKILFLCSHMVVTVLHDDVI